MLIAEVGHFSLSVEMCHVTKEENNNATTEAWWLELQLKQDFQDSIILPRILMQSIHYSFSWHEMQDKSPTCLISS